MHLQSKLALYEKVRSLPKNATKSQCVILEKYALLINFRIMPLNKCLYCKKEEALHKRPVNALNIGVLIHHMQCEKGSL